MNENYLDGHKAPKGTPQLIQTDRINNGDGTAELCRWYRDEYGNLTRKISVEKN